MFLRARWGWSDRMTRDSDVFDPLFQPPARLFQGSNGDILLLEFLFQAFDCCLQGLDVGLQVHYLNQPRCFGKLL